MLQQEITEARGRVKHLVKRFPNKGVLIQAGRDAVKRMRDKRRPVAVKSFSRPTPINAFIYKYLFRSRAKQSFLNAGKLLALGINIPEPLGYVQHSSLWGIKDSYYVYRHPEKAMPLSELLLDDAFLQKEAVLEQYAAFLSGLHRKGVVFTDCPLENILVEQKQCGAYCFYLTNPERVKIRQAPLPFLNGHLQHYRDRYRQLLCFGLHLRSQISSLRPFFGRLPLPKPAP